MKLNEAEARTAKLLAVGEAGKAMLSLTLGLN